MTYSSLTNQVHATSQQSSRQGAAIDHIILHHSDDLNADHVVAEMVNASKQVSANYVIANDGTIHSVVPEEMRAWTSGSSTDNGRGAGWDRRSITFEVANETLAPDYLISDAAYKSIAALIVDISNRYGFPLTRAGADSTVFGHRELYTYFHASYATACPGGLNLDGVVALANAKPIPPKPKTGKPVRIIHEVNADATANLGFWAATDTDIWPITRDQERILTLVFFASGLDVEGNFVRMQTADVQAARMLLRAHAPVGAGGFPADYFSDADAATLQQTMLAALAAGNAAVLQAISQVDENTLATFGLKRI